MKKVAVSICNGLLAEALTATLGNSGEFQPYRVRRDTAVQDCATVKADILLLEAAYSENGSLDTVLREGRKLNALLPDCKIVLLCDENSAPEIAMEIRNAKKEGCIDAFFYTSVSSSYLLAALDTL